LEELRATVCLELSLLLCMRHVCYCEHCVCVLMCVCMCMCYMCIVKNRCVSCVSCKFLGITLLKFLTFQFSHTHIHTSADLQTLVSGPSSEFEPTFSPWPFRFYVVQLNPKDRAHKLLYKAKPFDVSSSLVEVSILVSRQNRKGGFV